jgi:hypothetical protein
LGTRFSLSFKGILNYLFVLFYVLYFLRLGPIITNVM